MKTPQAPDLQRARRATAQAAEPARAAALVDQRPAAAMQRQTVAALQNSTRMALQRQALAALQRTGAEEEEPLQGAGLQVVQAVEEEEPLQGAGLQVVQAAAEEEEPLQAKPAGSGQQALPAGLQAGVQALSGQSLAGVRVHHNSGKPAQVQAAAYAQGEQIHLGPGQEQHLPHEAWHVVQQRQGRVKPTVQLAGGVAVNDDVALEHEADVMGAKALQAGAEPVQRVLKNPAKAGLNAKLVRRYHQAEEAGDGFSPLSKDVNVHLQAIDKYKQAKKLRRDAGRLHVGNDGGHLLAIATLDVKISNRQQRIAGLQKK